MSSLCIKIVSPRLTLWPLQASDDDDRNLSRIWIECAGEGYVKYQQQCQRRERDDGSKAPSNGDRQEPQSTRDNAASPGKLQQQPPPPEALNLLDYSAEEIKTLTHYEILNIPISANAEALKRAFHRACLKYHPDKTGRGEEDYVFLAIKGAYDVLNDFDKRRSYDSTVDFDNEIPPGGEGPRDFYEVYAPVFERNLRFAAATPANVGGKSKNKRQQQQQQSTADEYPPLGDDNTPIEEVQSFYEYWTHFESWRDFTLKASELTKHDVDSADSRDEKRWMAKEIDRKAKAFKREEMARINLLVERAMAADPRLKRHRDQDKLAKEQALVQKKMEEEKAQDERRRTEEKEGIIRQKQENEERTRRAEIKADKEREKKNLRKSRQSFRKITMMAYESAAVTLSNKNKGKNDTSTRTKFWNSLHDMNDDIELCCGQLSAVQLDELTNVLLGGADAVLDDQQSDGGAMKKIVKPDGLHQIKKVARELRDELKKDVAHKAVQRDKARQEAAENQAKQKAASASRPWSKEELSALAKAVKKYPPGGANRWETVALFINNLLSAEEPRTKEECIAQYNTITSNVTAATELGSAVIAAASSLPLSRKSMTADGTAISILLSSDEWTDDMDKQLQDGLANFPSSMDKNERWTLIAKGVPGKTKKDCVQRYKVIREALRSKGTCKSSSL